MSEEWFILQFKPNAHLMAKRNLNRQGFKTFLPIHSTTSRKKTQFTNTSRPLFPGYMFVEFDRANTKWHKINSTYGVSRLVTFNSTLKSIPNIVINSLKKRCDPSGKLLPVKKLKTGDQVTILKGPFANFIATVETHETDQRIWILMDLMGGNARVQTPTKNLQLSSQ